MISVSVLIVAITISSLSISNADALTNVENPGFSINVPDNWAYQSSVYEIVRLTPNEFAVFLHNQSKPLVEIMKQEGALVMLAYDRAYAIKSAPFDAYVKYKISEQNGANVTSKQNATIDNKPAVVIQGDGLEAFNGIKFLEYMLMHGNQPYYIEYMANEKDYQKYLPQFEQIVKSFKFTK